MMFCFSRRVWGFGLGALLLTGGGLGVAQAEIQLHGGSQLATKTTTDKSHAAWFKRTDRANRQSKIKSSRTKKRTRRNSSSRNPS